MLLVQKPEVMLGLDMAQRTKAQEGWRGDGARCGRWWVRSSPAMPPNQIPPCLPDTAQSSAGGPIHEFVIVLFSSSCEELCMHARFSAASVCMRFSQR